MNDDDEKKKKERTTDTGALKHFYLFLIVNHKRIVRN